MVGWQRECSQMPHKPVPGEERRSCLHLQGSAQSRQIGPRKGLQRQASRRHGLNQTPDSLKSVQVDWIFHGLRAEVKVSLEYKAGACGGVDGKEDSKGGGGEGGRNVNDYRSQPKQTNVSPSLLDDLSGWCTFWKAFIVLFELILSRIPWG